VPSLRIAATTTLAVLGLMPGWTAGIAASLKGSPNALAFQLQAAKEERLPRITRDREMTRLVAGGVLVPLPENRTIRVDPELKAAYRYVVPWTRKFLLDLAQAHWAEFGKPLQVNSATRTLAYQRRLRGHNVNAAVRSSHLYGATVDLAKRDLSPREVEWLRKRLLALEDSGLVEATEEFQQPCFHIMVLKDYAGRAHPTRAAN
jgi:hypothetical protein